MYSSDFSGALPAGELISGGKLFQAYIISGAGSGKTALANRLAARAVCSEGGQTPCGVCRDCRKAAAGLHPDIIFISPEAGEKGGASYPVKEIRRLCADAAVMPNEAKHKVYIITDASIMSEACQNVLLKTLEEPPKFTVFILLAENSANLQPTVRSRCTSLYAPDENAACSENTEKLAAGLMDAVASGDRVALAEYLFSLEGISKQDAAELSDELLRQCAAGARENAAGKNCGIPSERLLKMAAAFEEIKTYCKFNVSSGHMIGLLMAELL